MDRERLLNIVNHFHHEGTINEISPWGSGLINDTYLVTTIEPLSPDYVLQRINHQVFRNIDLLQHNIDVVTYHIRQKLIEAKVPDLNRKVLQFISVDNGKSYYYDGNDQYWRMSILIPRSYTYNKVTPDISYEAGLAFGQFEYMLADVPKQLGETIPNFHNMEFRLAQLAEAVKLDAAKRVNEVGEELDSIMAYAEEMCLAENLFREGKLPKRLCHCDTKVNNMLFDERGHFLCVIDLDTVMPSFIFSDYGDFLRTAANTVAEDSSEFNNIHFKTEIFEAFTKGYLYSTKSFITELEVELLSYAIALFPMMQCVRFLADYLSGDIYYKTQYPSHNLVRARNQLIFFNRIKEKENYIRKYIASWS
jgi:Ser/Thr protein kinase RdoA (MazF antagonist)